MPELTDQEKMERRRQKRQQRILTSAGDRLSRITGTAYPLRASPSPSPSTSASSLAKSDTPHQMSTLHHDQGRHHQPSLRVHPPHPLNMADHLAPHKSNNRRPHHRHQLQHI
ncbi:unnamed protein product [Absidia cylindrospora]